MSVNIKQIKYNISPSQYFTAMYQSSLPEGNVDCTRIVQNFTGQMKSHQDLCTAKDCNDNLRRRRGRMDGTDSRITVCSGSLSVCVCIYYLCYPKTSGLFLEEAMQGLAGHQNLLVCLLTPIFSCRSLSTRGLGALHCP